MPILGTKGNNMLINCPKCQTTYNIDASAVPEGGRKLHCTNCDEIFWCNPEDLEEPTRLLTEEEKRGGIAAERRENPAFQAAELNRSVFAGETEADPADNLTEETAETSGDTPLPEENGDSTDALENETSEPQDAPADEKSETEQDIQDIFQRLSLQSEQINRMEREMSIFRRGCRIVCDTFGWERRFNRLMFYGFLTVFVCLGLYSERFAITRIFPAAEKLYNAIGIESRIVGEGLKFSNVSRREYEVDDIRQMEIRGFIDNESDRRLEVPKLHLEILDNEGEIIQQKDELLYIREIAPGDRKPFKVIIEKPSVLGKYIYITFIR